MFKFRIIACAAAISWLSGCTLSAHHDDSVDWNDIDYAKIVCEDNKTAPPACKAPDSRIIGGGGHHGGHK